MSSMAHKSTVDAMPSWEVQERPSGPQSRNDSYFISGASHNSWLTSGLVLRGKMLSIHVHGAGPLLSSSLDDLSLQKVWDPIEDQRQGAGWPLTQQSCVNAKKTERKPGNQERSWMKRKVVKKGECILKYMCSLEDSSGKGNKAARDPAYCLFGYPDARY